LIAGPVLHHKQMMPQFSNPNTFLLNKRHLAIGLAIFVLGLSKKVLIADTLADYVTPIFKAVSNGYTLMLFEAWIGAIAYTLQLYFDFSGYSDMAIGLSLMFNVRLPMNFNSPYKAINMIDFWRRWHITLSTFLRDYLYIPLGGNRKGSKRRYFNLMATMLLGGLWHGAGWTFIIWGCLHGLYLMINHGWREVKIWLNWSDGGKFANLISGILTFIAVVVAWVFFRADNIDSASSMLSSMLGIHGVSLPSQYTPILRNIPYVHIQITNLISGIEFNAAVKKILICLIMVWFFPNVQEIFTLYKPVLGVITFKQVRPNVHPTLQERIAFCLRWKLTTKYAIISGFLFTVVLLSMISNKTSEFLYFQF
jgi:D-alanyl-lipoteichoic acid acyltransferase DltB (MBOAT superfamily)